MTTITEHHAELICDNFVKSVKIQDLIEDAVSYNDSFIDKFGIDDARELVRQAHQGPSDFDTLVMVVRTDFITLEAQNALLKVLEEPPTSTKFIFVVPPDFSMIATLRSRFFLRTDDSERRDSLKNEVFESFINSSYQDRLTSIEKATKDKNIDWQREIKRGLINHVRTAQIPHSTSLVSLHYVAQKLLTRGASNKMLLEHAALILGTRL